MFNAVDRALAFLHKLGGLDLRPDGELPVRTGLALCDNRIREFPGSDDLAGYLQMPVHHLRGDKSHTPKRVVFVVGEERDALRDVHPRHIDHDGARPAEESHLAAGVGHASHGRLLPLGGSRYFKIFSLHLHPFRSSVAPPPARCRAAS